jgi:hypothetical protein
VAAVKLKTPAFIFQAAFAGLDPEEVCPGLLERPMVIRLGQPPRTYRMEIPKQPACNPGRLSEEQIAG